MFDNILVPLDGTASSERALPYAEALAARMHAGLTLVRQAFEPSVRLGDSAIDQQRAIIEAEDYLSAVSSKLRDRGFAVQTGCHWMARRRNRSSKRLRCATRTAS